MPEERLNFEIDEPGDDPASDQVLDILRNVLQTDSTTSVDTAVVQITDLFPAGQPSSVEVYSFLGTCYEVVQQIPYDHESMLRLIDLIDLCLTSPRIRPADNSGISPYSLLSQTIRDFCDTTVPDRDPAKYVNLETFQIRLYERRLLSGCSVPIWAVQEAFERGKGSTQEARDAYVKAALLYLIVRSDSIYLELTKDSHHYKLRPQHEQKLTEDDWKQYKWRKWYEQVRAVAAEKADNKACAYGQDTLQLAGRAMEAMEAFERYEARLRCT